MMQLNAIISFNGQVKLGWNWWTNEKEKEKARMSTETKLTGISHFLKNTLHPN